MNALDLTGVDGELRTDAGAGGRRDGEAGLRAAGYAGLRRARPGMARLRAFLEIKTVWHPTGALSLSGGSAY